MRHLACAIMAVVGGYGVLLGQGTVLSPSGGFLFDAPTGGVYAVLGTAGSSSLGDPVLTDVSFASIEPGQKHAVACSSRACFLAGGLDSSNPSRIELPPLPTRPEGAAWSADGSTVVLFSLEMGWIRGINSLINGPTLAFQFDLPAGAGPLRAVAVGNGKAVIAIGGEQGGVFELTNAAGLAKIAGGAKFVDLAFGIQGDVLYALDSNTREVVEINLASRLSRRFAAPLGDPTAVRPWRNAERKPVLYVAGGADQVLVALDPVSGNVQERIDLAFAPKQLAPLHGGTLLLTSRHSAAELLWTFVPGRGTFFIPAPAERTANPRRRRP